jgi:hypothetical protein
MLTSGLEPVSLCFLIVMARALENFRKENKIVMPLVLLRDTGLEIREYGSRDPLC